VAATRYDCSSCAAIRPARGGRSPALRSACACEANTANGCRTTWMMRASGNSARSRDRNRSLPGVFSTQYRRFESPPNPQQHCAYASATAASGQDEAVGPTCALAMGHHAMRQRAKLTYGDHSSEERPSSQYGSLCIGLARRRSHSPPKKASCRAGSSRSRRLSRLVKNVPSAGRTASAGCASSRSRTSVVPLRCAPQTNTGRQARSRPRDMSPRSSSIGPWAAAAVQTASDQRRAATAMAREGSIATRGDSRKRSKSDSSSMMRPLTGPHLGQPACMQMEDLVAGAQRAWLMRDQQDRTAAAQARACDTDPLPLTSAQANAALADPMLIAFRQAGDELLELRGAGRLCYATAVDPPERLAKSDVLRDARVQQHERLRYVSDRGAPRLPIALVESGSIHPYGALVRHEQPGDDIHQSRLARAVGADDAYRRAGGNARGDARQSLRTLRGIAERHAIQENLRVRTAAPSAGNTGRWLPHPPLRRARRPQVRRDQLEARGIGTDLHAGEEDLLQDGQQPVRRERDEGQLS